MRLSTMRATQHCDPRVLQKSANWLCRASVERTGRKREIAQPPRTDTTVILISVCGGYSSKHFGLARLKCERKERLAVEFDPTPETPTKVTSTASIAAGDCWRLDNGDHGGDGEAVAASVSR